MIETASFTMPSPNTRLKSLGCYLGLMRETAAITSEEQRREHISKISTVCKFNVVSIQALLSLSQVYCLTPNHLVYPIVIAEKEPNAMNVPSTPNNKMFPMFAKNFLRYMLKPDANTIGGKTK